MRAVLEPGYNKKEKSFHLKLLVHFIVEALRNCFRILPEPSVMGGLNILLKTSLGRFFFNGSKIFNYSEEVKSLEESSEFSK